ncbi:class I SAM-dependent methyltransferase [Oligoflexia bacterium]|nr:class I SAM-dependent methyltransferase [Oligoflexia bacterium]
MDVPELQLFNDLAFCWEFFEEDGLNGSNIKNYLEYVASPVLVVGSGQGVVAKDLIEQGFDVCCIDCSEAMAKFANQRFGIETQVIDFLDFKSDKRFNTVIINTGVIFPKVIKAHAPELARKIHDCLFENGHVLLSFFQVTDFDATAKELKLHKASKLLVELWLSLQEGMGLSEFLKRKYSMHPALQYLLHRHKTDILEFEAQVKNACAQFMKVRRVDFNDPELLKFISEALPYVPYGISRDEQISLFAFMIKMNLSVKVVDSYGKLIVSILSKTKENLGGIN